MKYAQTLAEIEYILEDYKSCQETASRAYELADPKNGSYEQLNGYKKIRKDLKDIRRKAEAKMKKISSLDLPKEEEEEEEKQVR